MHFNVEYMHYLVLQINFILNLIKKNIKKNKNKNAIKF
jgi:hypothetical protein